MANLPSIGISGTWEELFKDAGRAGLEKLLPEHLKARRWFGSKARQIRAVSIHDIFRMPFASANAYFALIRVEFTEGPAERYVLPLAFADSARQAMDSAGAVARVEGAVAGVLYDALTDIDFCSMLLDALTGERRFQGTRGEILATRVPDFTQRRGPDALRPKLASSEQSNTSVIFGDRFIMKIYRRLQDGTNPDLEVGRFLTENAHFTHTAPVLGAIEYRESVATEPITLAILQGFVPNRGDAWKLTLEKMNDFAERVRTVQARSPENIPKEHLLDIVRLDAPAEARQHIGGYLDSARLLGQRTAELHLALSSSNDSEAFRPEPFSLQAQQRLVQALLDVIDRNCGNLDRYLKELPGDIHTSDGKLTEQLKGMRSRFQTMLERPLSGLRCRCHGDYHLGQVLYTGEDFIIIDFEGEPARPLEERRLKQSPLRDVAGMLRSFDYAAHSVPMPEAWHRFWYTWVSAAFLKGYLVTAKRGDFLPTSREETRLLLDYYLLEKAVYELEYEMNHRPDWVRIPLQGIITLVGNQL